MAAPVIIPVIMCGGSGKRLWPLSRENFPKQFLRLDMEMSLLQKTVKRFPNTEVFKKPVILSNYRYRFHCAEQLSEIGIKNPDILLEHHSRNTAPALAASAYYIKQKYGDNCLILALPSDHYFEKDNNFEQTVISAIKTAQDGNIVTFGITPTHAETGYGYIQYNSASKANINKIIKFHEKPDAATAEAMLAKGNYLWNSGIFLYSPAGFLTELEKYNPEIASCAKLSLEQSEVDFGFTCLGEKAYAECPNISVDYAIMEHTDKGYVCNWKTDWKDLGGWQAIYDLFPKDKNNNVLQGKVITKNSTDCLVRSNNKLTAILGVDDLIVIDTQDALLIAKKSSVNDIKDLVESLPALGYNEHKISTQEYRPWGYYCVIQDSADYKVKKIHVHPGKKLSLQKHEYRAEHWVILSGTAKITCDDKTNILRRDQSTYIPNQSVHRIENIGLDDLIFIEVQTGNYLGEDDIIRLDDDFGRHGQAGQLEKKKLSACLGRQHLVEALTVMEGAQPSKKTRAKFR